MIKTAGVHHITLIGSNKADTVHFYQDILGMPLVFEQPNLDVPEELHLFFDAGDSKLITFFCNDNRESDPRAATMTTMGMVHHVAFTVSREMFERALKGLGESRIPNSGRVDRGFMDSLYFRDHNGQLLELSVYKVAPPEGFTTAEVLAVAHTIRVEAGADHIEEQHMRQAVEELAGRPSVAPS